MYRWLKKRFSSKPAQTIPPVEEKFDEERPSEPISKPKLKTVVSLYI